MDSMAVSFWRIPDAEAVGKLLGTARRALHLSQAELARRLGVSQVNVSRIEAGGDMRVSTLIDIARALGFELMIVPKAAAPAVRSVLDDVTPRSEPSSEARRFTR